MEGKVSNLPQNSTPKSQRTNGLPVGMERLADQVNGEVILMVEGVQAKEKKDLESGVQSESPVQNRIGHRKTASNASTSSLIVSVADI